MERYEEEKNERRKVRTFDTVVKAVATGIFIVSLFLNLLLFLIIIGMGASMRTSRDRLLGDSGYRKIYLKNGLDIQRGEKKQELEQE